LCLLLEIWYKFCYQFFRPLKFYGSPFLFDRNFRTLAILVKKTYEKSEILAFKPYLWTKSKHTCTVFSCIHNTVSHKKVVSHWSGSVSHRMRVRISTPEHSDQVLKIINSEKFPKVSHQSSFINYFYGKLPIPRWNQTSICKCTHKKFLCHILAPAYTALYN
jgi:hypothetical protein